MKIFKKQKEATGGSAGFTLVELVVVIAIMSLAIVIAAPAMRDWIQNADLNADVRHVYSALQYARTEAVKRNVDCTVVRNQVVVAPSCPSGFGDPSPAGQPYDFVAYADQNDNDAFDDGEELLCGNLSNAVIASPDPAWVPVPSPPDANVASPGPNDSLLPVTFSGRGIPDAGGTLFIQGGHSVVHTITMAMTGRLRVE